MRHEPSDTPRLNIGASSHPLSVAVTELPDVPTAFAALAVTQPQAVAVSDGQRTLTYGELAAAANQVARALHARGIGPEALVGVCLDRSVDLIVALLGILTAGAAYLPIDPAYPLARRTFIAHDAALAALIAPEGSIPLPEVPLLPPDGAPWHDQPTTPLDLPISPTHLAYVIYTSGSTGQPKGVEITHANLSNLLTWYNHAFGLGPSDRVSQVVAPGFDGTIMEIWPALTSGASLHIVDAETRLAPPALRDWLVREGITLSMLPTALAEPILHLPWPATVPLRWLLTGAEALHTYPPAAFPATLVNNYGPTETTVLVTSGVIPPTPHATQPPTIGRAVAHARLYVLDAQQQPVPQGVVGELYIGGAPVGRGYRGRPELTQERFLPDPFNPAPAARMYRTGDLCRWQTEGTLAYIGRTDQQVQVRGNRVEVGEIESVLRRQPGVGQAVVVVGTDLAGQPQLLAYLVAQAGQTLAADTIRAGVAQELPGYMVPAAMVVLSTLPLTANGKVDRAALPPPMWETDAEVAPRTPTEAFVAEVWAEVLGRTHLSVTADFFASGGHSLLATRVMARLRARYQSDLPLRLLFDAPTIAQLAAAIDQAQEEQETSQVPPLVAHDHTLPQPLSYAQERMWFLEQLQPDSALSVVALTVIMKRALDMPTLDQALQAVVARHESLRTTFRTTLEGPQQIIAPMLHVPLRVVDLRGLPSAEREAAWALEAEQEARTPFALAQGPLLRMVAIQMEAMDTRLLIAQHHIISDGWSMAVFLQDLLANYEALLQDQPPVLPPLPVQYADYALWQRQWLSEGALDAQVAYWQRHLADAPQVLDLPTDFPRPPVLSYRGARHSFLLPPDLVQQVEALRQQEGSTLSMTLLAVFAMLLQRYTRQDDFLLGTVVAGRQLPELDQVIGFFVNTLPLHVDLTRDPSFREVLARMRTLTLDAFAHQDVPFERIVEAMQPKRDLSYNPLIQVMFVMQNTALGTLETSDGSVRIIETETGMSQFDLTLEFTETSEGLSGALHYNTDIFAASTIARMEAHFTRLLAGAVAAPDHSVARLPLLSTAEWDELVAEHATEQIAVTELPDVPTAFAALAVTQPQAVAVSDGQRTLTYGELAAAANQVARALHARGIGPEALVGVCLDRSVDLIVALLGILTAGAAYLPIDPAYPLARRTFIAHDAALAALIAPEGSIPLPEVPLLPPDGAAWHDQPTTPLDLPISPTHLAYVIYTSGSTGQPKGVEITHANLSNLLTWYNHAFGLGPGDRVSQVVAPGFDGTIMEIWPALTSGASLHIVDAETRLAPPALRDWLVREGITLSMLPTALAEPILHLPWPATVPLRWLLTGAEALHTYPPAAFPATLVNNYGPTETTVLVTSGVIPPTPHATQPPTIGRAVAHARLYVLDAQQQPVPQGVVGELYIGGAPVGRGYRGRPELTQERFLPDPFSPVPQARMYRTGDLCRWQTEGTLAYIGRTDQQVQVRGNRVEVGEIESVLRRQPGVGQAVVVVGTDPAGQPQLLAYLVAQAGQTLAADTIRAGVAQELPGYMVPAAMVVLPTLPLTANGKVDRAALPAPTWETDAEVAPRTPTEAFVAEVWAEVLGRTHLSVTADFFASGGHSLLATRVMARLRARYQSDLPLRLLFDAPTIAQLAAAIDQIVGESAATPSDSMPRVARGQPLPLTDGQERLWFLDQLAPDSALYRVPVALRLPFAVQADVFTATLQYLAARHESWRTAFIATPDGPRQTIAAAVTIPWRNVSVLDLPPAEQEIAVTREAQYEARVPFDLSAAPLVRVVTIATGPETTLVLITQHHIITDGWSLDVLAEEMQTIYRALAAGRAPALPTLPVQPVDYAAWQATWAASDAAREQVARWQARLANVPTVLALPTDFPRPTMQTYHGALHHFTLPADLVNRLRAVSQQQGVTPYMVLLAAFEILLQRYSRQEQFVVGTVVAGRPRAELEGLLGFFVNTLPLPVDLTADPSFTTFLAQTRQLTLAAQEDGEVPFDRLLDAVPVERDASHAPLVQVLFTFQSSTHPTLVPLAELDWDLPIAKFELTLDVVTGEGAWDASLEYNTDLFAPASIARMSTHFTRLLAALLANPAAPVSAHRLLDAVEERQVLVELNAATVPVPELGLAALFEQQVARTPTAIALITPETTLSYAELNAQANQLAWHLRDLGIGTEQIVGVCLHRTADLIVALLGVLKSGAAYVPLDPAYPPERLAYSLTDAQAPVLITSQDLRTLVPDSDARMVTIDTLRTQLQGYPAENLPLRTTPDALGYVIYTSGSTGKPKGVAITQRSAVALVAWAQTLYDPADLQGVLAATSVCFDLSIFEIFVPLSMGGTVILAENALALPSLAARESVTLVNTVPSALNELVQMGGLPTTVHVINVAGEPLAQSLVDRLYALSAVRQVYNLYGPTEDTTYSTWAAVPRQARAAPAIGRPIANSQLYLVDDHLQPVPIGVPGEIYLAGAGLARGYLGRPDLTAERFVPDPFTTTPGARMYRTGDLGRLRLDGEVEYLGRIDSQVKVRGFRIELGEVESALRRITGVHDAVVVVRDDTNGTQQLVAYVVTSDAMTASVMQAKLREQLPGYMIPAAFVALAALPLMPNGKVDRHALPAPTWQVEGAYLAPRTDLEAQLAAIWADVMQREQVGVTDNFFALGGHSLLATRLIARIRATLAPDLALSALFAAPTIAELAALVAESSATPVVATSLPTVPRDQPLRMSAEQERLWFFDQLVPESILYTVPFALRLRFAVEVNTLAATLHQMMLRHESWRTTFQMTADGPRQIIAHEAPVPLRVVDLRHLPLAERDHAIQSEAQREAHTPFDLRTGPLVRVLLLPVAPQETLLVITQHHIITDATSLSVMADELLTIYAALQAGQPLALPELPAQAADYAGWQHTWLGSPDGQAQLTFWQKQLDAYPTILELPTDAPRPAVQTYSGALHPFALDAELMARLQSLARAQGATPYMVLLAAFEVLVQRYTEQDMFLIGTAVAGRTHASLENALGFFVNTLPLPADLSSDPTFTHLVQKTRWTVLAAQENGDIPFDAIVEAVQPTRSASHSPLVQVLFTVTEASDQLQMHPEASVVALDWDMPIAKFDLAVEVNQDANGWHGQMEYNTALFTPATIARLSNHYLRLLRGLLAEPDRSISAIPLLAPNSADPIERAEWHQVVEEWNATTRTYPREATLAQVFIAQAQATPDAIALVAEDQHLSYATLLARASQLAHHLRTLGVGPEVPVGLALERSVDLVPALLGIVLAGGAYVPLDPSYPPARLTQMLADSGAVLVLTQPHLHGPFQAAPVPLLDVNHLWPLVTGYPTTPPTVAGTAADLAYLCYTSGSTGLPKGVAIPQRAVLRLVCNGDCTSFGPATTFLQFAPLAFDAATLELWGPLLTGGRLVIAPAGPVGLDALAQVLRQQAITTLWLTAGLFHVVAEEALPLLAGLCHLLAGGDVLHPAAVQRVRTTYPQLVVSNGYGPTENTTFATCYAMQGAGEMGGSVPIGRPIANTTCYVLDAQQQPVPIGVAGELYLGGDGLARGYWRQAGLTGERFVPHPFVAGERLYRTGDRVRWQAEGTLVFEGRRDGQVKVRGYRIEVGEVERALGQVAGVQASVVVVRTTEGGEKQVVGYVVGAGITASQVRAAMQAMVPAYLVPAVIVVVPRLPLTPNGKVDRAALQAMEQAVAVTPESEEAPQGEREEQLAAVWAEVLQRSTIGRHANFFEIGGHSLLATRLVVRLRAVFQVDVPLVAVFEYATIATQAAYLATLQPFTSIAGANTQIQRAARGDQDLGELLGMIEQLSDDELLALLQADAHNETAP